MIIRGTLSLGWNDRAEGERKITEGDVFIKTFLPFSVTNFDAKSSKVRMVEPENVLAGHFYKAFQLSTDDEKKLMDWLDSQHDINGHDTAQYIKIGAFDLYVALEGKNRVSLYRKHNRKIKAFVTETEYPNNNNLRLIKLLPFGGYALQYVGKNKIVGDKTLTPLLLGFNLAVLAFDDAVNFYESYGVKKGWPKFSIFAPLITRKAKIYVNHSFYIK